MIRTGTDDDWPEIFAFYSAIMAEGRTYAFPEGQTLDEARPWWMEQPPGRTVVAIEGQQISGSAKMGANRPGRGGHVATASFLVDPPHQGKGIGRALGEHVVEWARKEGYRGIQFNAVVEVNRPPCTCGSPWGSRSSARCPRHLTIRTMEWSGCT